jgi:signal transduction histidine kinase
MTQREIGSPFNTPMAAAANAPNGTIAGAHKERPRAGAVWRSETTSRDGLVEALTTLSGRLIALKARNRKLEAEVRQLARRTPTQQAERRRLERDLHDCVQNELVSLLVKLRRIEQDRDTPPALAGMLASVGANATAALDSLREITLGVPPPVLLRMGVLDALRAQVKRTPADVSLQGTAPRSSAEAEVAVYFSCLEAIQNVAKHAGPNAQVTFQLHHAERNLTVRIADDGVGFDPADTLAGAGLKNIRDRIQTMGGSVKINSRRGRGTLVAIELPWPPRHRDARARAPVAEDRRARHADRGHPRHHGPSSELVSDRARWAK